MQPVSIPYPAPAHVPPSIRHPASPPPIQELARAHAHQLRQHVDEHTLGEMAADVYARAQGQKQCPRQLVLAYCKALAVDTRILPHAFLEKLGPLCIDRCVDTERAASKESVSNLILGLCAFRQIDLRSDQAHLSDLIESRLDQIYLQRSTNGWKLFEAEIKSLYCKHHIWRSPGRPVHSLIRLIKSAGDVPTTSLFVLEQHMLKAQHQFSQPQPRLGSLPALSEINWKTIPTLPPTPVAMMAVDGALRRLADEAYSVANRRTTAVGLRKQSINIGIAYLRQRYQLLTAVADPKTHLDNLRSLQQRIFQWQQLDPSRYVLQTELVAILHELIDKGDQACMASLYSQLVKRQGWAEIERVPHQARILRALQQKLSDTGEKEQIDRTIRFLVRRSEKTAEEYITDLRLRSCQQLLKQLRLLQPLPKKRRRQLVLQMVRTGLNTSQPEEQRAACSLLFDHSYLQQSAELYDLICQRAGTLLTPKRFSSLLTQRFKIGTPKILEPWGKAALHHARQGSISGCTPLIEALKATYPVLAWDIAHYRGSEDSQLCRQAILSSPKDSAAPTRIKQYLALGEQLDKKLTPAVIAALKTHGIENHLELSQQLLRLDTKAIASAIGSQVVTALVKQDQKQQVAELIKQHPALLPHLIQSLTRDEAEWILALPENHRKSAAEAFLGAVSKKPSVARFTALFTLAKTLTLEIQGLANSHAQLYVNALDRYGALASCTAVERHSKLISPAWGNPRVTGLIKDGLRNKQANEREAAWHLALKQEALRPTTAELRKALAQGHKPSEELASRWLKQVLTNGQQATHERVLLCTELLKIVKHPPLTLSRPLDELLAATRPGAASQLQTLARKRGLIKAPDFRTAFINAVNRNLGAQLRYDLLHKALNQTSKRDKALTAAVIACFKRDLGKRSQSKDIVTVMHRSLGKSLKADPKWRHVCEQALTYEIQSSNQRAARTLFDAAGACLGDKKHSFELAVLILGSKWGAFKKAYQTDSGDPKVWLSPYLTIPDHHLDKEKARAFFVRIHKLTILFSTEQADHRRTLITAVLDTICFPKDDQWLAHSSLSKECANALVALLRAAAVVKNGSDKIGVLRFLHLAAREITNSRSRKKPLVVSQFPKKQQGQFLGAIAKICSQSTRPAILQCGHRHLIHGLIRRPNRFKATMKALEVLYGHLLTMVPHQDPIALAELLEDLSEDEMRASKLRTVTDPYPVGLIQGAVQVLAWAPTFETRSGHYSWIASAIETLVTAQRLPPQVEFRMEQILCYGCQGLVACPEAEHQDSCVAAITQAAASKWCQRVVSVLLEEHFPTFSRLRTVEQLGYAQRIVESLNRQAALNQKQQVSAYRSLLEGWQNRSWQAGDEIAGYSRTIDRLLRLKDEGALEALTQFAKRAGSASDANWILECLELCSTHIGTESVQSRQRVVTALYTAYANKQVSDEQLGLLLAHRRLANVNTLSKAHQSLDQELSLLLRWLEQTGPRPQISLATLHAGVEWLRVRGYDNIRLIREGKTVDLRTTASKHLKLLHRFASHPSVGSSLETSQPFGQHLQSLIATNGILQATATERASDWKHFQWAFKHYVAIREGEKVSTPVYKKMITRFVIAFVEAYLRLGREQILKNPKILPFAMHHAYQNGYLGSQDLFFAQLSNTYTQLIKKDPEVAVQVIQPLWQKTAQALTPQEQAGLFQHLFLTVAQCRPKDAGPAWRPLEQLIAQLKPKELRIHSLGTETPSSSKRSRNQRRQG